MPVAPRPARLAALLLLVGSVLLAGCGGGSADQAATATSSTVGSSTSTSRSTSTTAAQRSTGGATSSSAPAPTFADVRYADGSASQVLDLWVPPGATSATPLVVYVHGGAFAGGDKGMVASKVQPLLDAGYAVASVNYRLSGEATFPAGAQDVKAAVRFLRANATTYGLDPDRIAAWGESAGGHLAAILGTSGNQTSVLDDPSLGNADVSSAVRAVVDWYGPSDFLQMDAQAGSPQSLCTSPQAHDPASSPESRWIGAALQSAPATVAQADPITYIATNPTLPAFSIAAGTADCNVPFLQSQILADALTAAGGTVQLTIEPGWTHGDARFDAQLLSPTITWLDGALGR